MVSHTYVGHFPTHFNIWPSKFQFGKTNLLNEEANDSLITFLLLMNGQPTSVEQNISYVVILQYYFPIPSNFFDTKVL